MSDEPYVLNRPSLLSPMDMLSSYAFSRAPRICLKQPRRRPSERRSPPGSVSAQKEKREDTRPGDAMAGGTHPRDERGSGSTRPVSAVAGAAYSPYRFRAEYQAFVACGFWIPFVI